jgi:hypothetical protein
MAAGGLMTLALVLAALPLARGVAVDLAGWIGMGAAAAGVVLLALAAFSPTLGGWAAPLAAMPIAYLVLATAPQAMSRDLWPMARLLVSAAAAVAYFRVAMGLSGPRTYVACVAILGTGGLFFTLWEPPMPTPVPIAKPLADLEAQLHEAMPGWTGHHRKLDPGVEDVLKADEYLNLELKSPDKRYQVLVFITYNANAMSNVPHVPWVCMVQAGYRLVTQRQDDVVISSMPDKNFRSNVILFDGGEGRGHFKVLMFQYFNVGGIYWYDRQLTRLLATSGSLGQKGSFLSQTQVAIYIPPQDTEDPMLKSSWAYRTGVELLDKVVPRLEREYYPNLHSGEGG